jgi:4'-phosphopantetheinyl transferase
MNQVLRRMPAQTLDSPDASSVPIRSFDPTCLVDARGPLRVDEATVHVWSYPLRGTLDCLARCRSYLSSEERRRAARMIFEADRNEYVVAHGILRCILARYSACEPGEVGFAAHSSGKPRLITVPVGGHPLSFNLSHSGGHALLAVSDGREVGIDLERIRLNVDVLTIASRYFPGAECDVIELAPTIERAPRFFRYWVAKEAVLKAEGVGIGQGLDRLQIEFQADGAAARVHSSGPRRLKQHWSVVMLPVKCGWAAAVSAPAGPWRVRLEASHEIATAIS